MIIKYALPIFLRNVSVLVFRLEHQVLVFRGFASRVPFELTAKNAMKSNPS